MADDSVEEDEEILVISVKRAAKRLKTTKKGTNSNGTLAKSSIVGRAVGNLSSKRTGQAHTAHEVEHATSRMPFASEPAYHAQVREFYPYSMD
jgi:hypothetical protein